MLDILIAGLLLVLVLAFILRPGIQRLIVVGLLVLLTILVSGRIPDWFENVLPDNAEEQPAEGEVLRARAAFQDATQAIGGFLAQEGLSNGNDNIASDPGTPSENDNDFNSGVNNGTGDRSPDLPQDNVNQPDTTDPGAGDYQRAWW